MTKYPSVPLSEILEQEVDVVRVDPNETYPTAGILSFGRGLFTREPVLGAATTYSTFTRLHAAQLVYSRLFAWEGAIAVVDEPWSGLFVSPEFPTFRIRPDRGLPAYISYLCRWPSFHEAIAARTKGLGLRRQRVYPQELLTVEVPLPDLAEQRRVAWKLEVLLRSLDLLRSRLDAGGALTDSLRWAELRGIFERLVAKYGTRPLSEHVDLNPEPSNPKFDLDGETFVYVDIGSVGKGTGTIDSVQRLSVEEAPSRARRKIRRGDVILSTVRPNLRASAVVPPQLDGHVCSTGFAVLRPRKGLIPEFLGWQVLSDVFVDQLVGTTTGGHYPAVPDRRLRSIGIVVPTEKVQRMSLARLESFASGLLGVQQRRRAQVKSAEALGFSILNAAFDGTL